MAKSISLPKESPEQGLGFVFWQTTLLWQRMTSEALKKLNLTHVQFVLLAGVDWLTKHHQFVSQSMLAKHAKTDVMMTSKVVRTLEQKSLIKRLSHLQDTRVKILVLTAKGSKLLIKASLIVEEVEEQFFSLLGKEQRIFHHHLQNLLTLTTHDKS